MLSASDISCVDDVTRPAGWCMADLMKLSLDARTGFLLSRIDGRLSFEALFAVSGMSRMDTTRVLVQLLDQDIIAVP